MEEFSDKDRIANSKKNIKIATIFQLSAATLGFVERAFFINYLSSELLGLKGLIMSILMVLTITEYGISSSLAFYLYKPLVNKNQEKIKSLIKYMRKVYNTLTLTVLVLGFVLLPIFPTIANTQDINSNTLRLYFLIYLIGTTVSLKYSYHAIIIQADQKQFITTFYITTAQILQLFFQIGVLVLTQNFYLYALMYALANSIKFMFVKRKARKLFPFLKCSSKTIEKLPKDVHDKIRKETRVLIFHKMGFSITMTIECVLLSLFLGASVLGIFTNYQLVILGLATGVAFFQKSFESSIGNLCTVETKEKAYDWFLKINHVYSLSFGYMIAMLISMFNPFFNLFYPKAETFDYFTTLLIALTQYFYYKRLIVTIYESSYGIFYQDRFKPFIQTFLSITLAILLGKMFGACGIFGAIVLSELFTSTWIEPYMVHKYGFKQSQKAYWLEYFKNIIILAMCAFITYFVTNSLVLNALLTLVMNWVVTTISYFVLLSVVYPKNGKTIINWLFKKNKPVKIFSDYNNIK
jgi:hypothetical protein